MASRPWVRRRPAARGVIRVVPVGLLFHATGCGQRGLKRMEVARSKLASASKQNATLEARRRDGADWKTVEEYREAGPLTSETRVVRSPERPRRVEGKKGKP